MDDIVEFAGVRPFLDTAVKRYSSGMQMRLAFAVAAHLDPDILLLDEVLAVGDLSFQQKCLERVEGLVSEGRTLLFVSHSLDAIARFCDRCIWLDEGKIRRDGPADRVVEAYLEELAGVRSSRAWVPAEHANGAARPDQSEHAPERADSSPAEPVAGRMPGDDNARLVEVRLVGADGLPRSSVAVDEALGVEVTFDVLRAGKNVQPSVHFKNTIDQPLFHVCYTDPEWMRVPPAVGRHVTTAWVPQHFLNIGITHIAVALNTPDPFERHCSVDRAISFNVYERFGDDGTARGLYGREVPGAVRPLLRWETRRSVADTLAVTGPAQGRNGSGSEW